MKPEVITMCGSSRFADLMACISWEMEKKGIIVLRVNFIPDWYVKAEGWTESSHGAEQSGLKQVLDDLHCRKIDISDKVFVCNVNGYIGESTRNEINHALQMEKPVLYLEGKENEFTEMANKLVSWKRKSLDVKIEVQFSCSKCGLLANSTSKSFCDDEICPHKK